MRIIVIIGIIFTQVVYAQVSDEELEALWDTNIKAIIEMDESLIVELTQFPLEGDWIYMIDITDEGSAKDFNANLPVLFTEDFRSELASQDYTYLEEDGEDAVYKYMEMTVVEDMEYESMMIYRFRKINGVWKLVSIHIAG